MRVSQSRIKTWRRCRRAYHEKYVVGLRKKVPPRPLKFGTLVHRMGEHHLNGNHFTKAIEELTPQDWALFEDQIEEYGNIVGDAKDIMTEYVRHYSDDGLRYIKLNGRRAEHSLEMDIAPGITGVMILDFVARTGDGYRWLGDHKTFTQEMSDEDMWKNIQSTVYHRAWEAQGKKPLDGTLWDMIHSKVPTVPKLTKSGAISKAAIVTLPVVVKRFLKENGLKAKDHKDLLEVARECKSRYFKRVYMPRNHSVERMIYRDFVETAKQIQKRHGKDKARNIDRHCSWCEFKGLCHARLLGLDYKFVKRTQYYIDPARRLEMRDSTND